MSPPILLDGRTGQGGGQLVRVACGLAALTGQSVTIEHVRGNRQGGRGGGLKAQHVTSLLFLAHITNAQTHGLTIGSHSLTFHPRLPPRALAPRHFRVDAPTDAASALLILQAILPYVLFAGNPAGEPLSLDIHGGTNVDWSLSYEYLDQVLMPVLEARFGIRPRRDLKTRGWNLGPPSRGHIALVVQPIQPGESLRFVPRPAEDTHPASFRVRSVDASIIVPGVDIQLVRGELVRLLGDFYPGVEMQAKVVEDSGHDARWYILLVAHSEGGTRWGRDTLFSMPKRGKLSVSRVELVRRSCAALCKALYGETSREGTVDEFLQDQLVSLQVLAEGYSTFPWGAPSTDEEACDGLVERLGKMEVGHGAGVGKEKTDEPFGKGSTHATTARWVASQLVPGAEFYHGGDTVKGVGFSV